MKNLIWNKKKCLSSLFLASQFNSFDHILSDFLGDKVRQLPAVSSFLENDITQISLVIVQIVGDLFWVFN